MRRIISVLISATLVVGVAYLGGVYLGAIEAPVFRGDCMVICKPGIKCTPCNPKDPIAAKYDMEVKPTLWVCPSLLTLKDEQIPEIFVVTDGDTSKIDDGYKWEDVGIDRKFRDSEEFLVAEGPILCRYSKVVYGGAPRLWREVGYIDVSLSSDYIGEVDFQRAGTAWIFLAPFDVDYVEAFCQESREACTFFVTKRIEEKQKKVMPLVRDSSEGIGN